MLKKEDFELRRTGVEEGSCTAYIPVILIVTLILMRSRIRVLLSGFFRPPTPAFSAVACQCCLSSVAFSVSPRVSFPLPCSPFLYQSVCAVSTSVCLSLCRSGSLFLLCTVCLSDSKTALCAGVVVFLNRRILPPLSLCASLFVGLGLCRFDYLSVLR